MVLGRAFVLVMLATAIAHADAPSPAPWADGVSDENKAKAKEQLDAGNALLLDKKYVEALERYTAAIAFWDHPAIRFNMVRCLIQLGKNLEAYESLEKALAYGAAPLEETVYNEALAYQKLLASQVGDVDVSCDQPGVTLTLDGHELSTCPTQFSKRLLAGQHQIVGTKQGLLPKTVEFVIAGAKPQVVNMHLDPLSKAAHIEHRWPQWVPYTVMFSGIGIGAIGGLFQYLGSQQMHDYDKWVDERCTGNCQADELADVADLKSGARLKSGIGISMMVTGGAAVLTGAAMLYLNRGRTVYREQTLQVAPTNGGAAVSWSGSW
jgi:hypothetical protein